MDWITGVLLYFLGAFTFIPLMLWLTQLYITVYQSPAPSYGEYDYATQQQQQQQSNADVTTGHNYGTKEGWVFLTSNYQPTTSSIKRHVSGGREGYGVFKQGILKIYNNEAKHRCDWTLDLNDYVVSIYPPGRQEHTLFSRSVALLLQRKQPASTSSSSLSASSSSSSSNITTDETTSTTTTTTTTLTANKHGDLFFTCTRSFEKEDWYFAFMSVANTSPTSHRAIPFDPMAVASLISFVGKEKYQSHQTSDTPIPWFNAVLGRTFLGIYKTHRIQQYVLETLAKKTLKMKTPGFLGDIQVRSVDLGYAIPFVTNPTLVELSPDGTLVLDALVDYRGGFKVVVEASAGGGGVSFSIRVPLVLSLTLESLSGTIRFKIKPPPSNRYWIGFCTMPTMKWSILPAVSNYNVKLSMVTKIIEAKIRRMMTENMVLPNMVDIPFAKSDGKGGIFHELNDNIKDGCVGDVGTTTIHHTDEASTENSSGDDDGGGGDGDDDNDVDSSLQHSFIINNSNSHGRSMMDALSSSPAAGRWSKFFGNRRRKTATMTPTADDKQEQDELTMNSKQIDNGQTWIDDEYTDKTVNQQNGNDTSGMKQDGKEKSYHGNDINDDMTTTNTPIGNYGGPVYLSPSGTTSTLITQHSSATSLVTTAAESANTTTTNSSSTILGVDDDTSSIRSTPRKRIYNAAGYLLSKGKGLANDFREHRQQDLELKRQQSLLHYNDQLQDMRRRCGENTQRRQRRSSAAYPKTDTISITTTLLPKNLSTPPPLHLIHNDNNITSNDDDDMTSRPPSIDTIAPPLDEKPPLPPRPVRPPLAHISSSNKDTIDYDETQTQSDPGTTITKENDLNISSSSSSSSARTPFTVSLPVIPAMGNT